MLTWAIMRVQWTSRSDQTANSEAATTQWAEGRIYRSVARLTVSQGPKGHLGDPALNG